MYAIVEIAGLQYKVFQNQFVYVPQLEQSQGDNIIFSRILFLNQEGKIIIGNPLIKGIEVTGKILLHLNSDKIIILKKKRRKGYQIRRGHRQHLTKIKIISICKTPVS